MTPVPHFNVQYESNGQQRVCSFGLCKDLGSSWVWSLVWSTVIKPSFGLVNASCQVTYCCPAAQHNLILMVGAVYYTKKWCSAGRQLPKIKMNLPLSLW